jgi:hypothetical protein
MASYPAGQVEGLLNISVDLIVKFYLKKGYLLTKETMRRLVEKGLDENVCNTTIPGSADDVIIGMGILSAYLKIEFYKNDF